MAVSLVVLTGLTYERVTSAEHRALSLRPPAKPGVPNVLLIVLDDVRAASLSLYGYDRPTTPNLERLARRGVVFSEARSTAPWTLPSHASMMTGRWPHELSVGPDLPLDGTFPTLAETLGREGYATAGFVGNTVYCNALYGMGRGFARYEDAYENQTVSLFETVRSSGLGQARHSGPRLPDLGRRRGDVGPEDGGDAQPRRPRLARGATRRPSRFSSSSTITMRTPRTSSPGTPTHDSGWQPCRWPSTVEIDKRFWDAAEGKPTPAGVTSQQADQRRVCPVIGFVR